MLIDPLLHYPIYKIITVLPGLALNAAPFRVIFRRTTKTQIPKRELENARQKPKSVSLAQDGTQCPAPSSVLEGSAARCELQDYTSDF
jgi:hypothetical protein